MGNEEEEDDGSDYYFSLPSNAVSENSNVNYFTAMGVADESDEVFTFEEDASIVTTEEKEEDTMHMEVANTMANVMVEELTAVVEPEDEEAFTTNAAAAAAEVLGSIRVPGPRHGFVRRSARLIAWR